MSDSVIGLFQIDTKYIHNKSTTMKKFFFTIFLFFVGVYIYADPVDEAKAIKVAKEFFIKKNLPIKESIANVHVKSRRGIGVNKNAPFYIFNADKGYVIVSGSDNTPSILGYSQEGTFNADSVPDNMQALLDTYEYQINYIETHNVVLTDNASSIREPIAPLLTCKWAQSFPYNLKCPINNGNHCVTGCLATALSQVMYYYKWPQKTTQDIPGYNLNINGVSTDIPPVPSGTEFDWDNMLPTYDESVDDSVSMYAVATLMSTVGTALNMFYNTGTSEALFSYYNEVPKKYFGYHENQKLIYRSDIENWEEVIYNELASRRPVVYGGQSANGGHAFVVDGYDGDQLFHVDWGWGGSQGYYLLDVMNEGDFSGVDADYDGSGFSKSQCAIINLVPSGWTADAEYTSTPNEKIESKGIKISGSLKTGQTQEIFIDLVNKGAGLYGSLELCCKSSLNSDFKNIANKGFTLKRRATRTAIIPWIPEEAGAYILYVRINNRTLDSLSVNIGSGSTTTNETGLRLVSIHMDGEDIDSKIVDPTDDQSTFVDVIGKDHSTTIAIKNVGSNRWEGHFKFYLCAFDDNSNTYKLYMESGGGGWGTPGYTWNFELFYSDLPCGKYRFEIYANDILIDDSWHFNIVEGVSAWAGPKEKRMLKIFSNQLEIPDNILAVDLADYGYLDIIPNDNPNTIYLYNKYQIPPTILKNRNVLVKNENSYVGNSINLQDGYSYYSPYTYTVKSIKFTKKISSSSTSSNTRWETFCLPFTASKSISNGLNYKWCTSVNDNSGNYWLEKLSQFIDNTAYFECENENVITEWRPYIIAVPEDVKEMTFSAENIEVSSSPSAMPRTNDYTFTSNFIQKESYDIYNIESDNNLFRWSSTKQLQAFNSYFLPNNDNSSTNEIEIKPEYVDIVKPTAIKYETTRLARRYVCVISPTGRKVDKLQKGLNIVIYDDGTANKILMK